MWCEGWIPSVRIFYLLRSVHRLADGAKTVLCFPPFFSANLRPCIHLVVPTHTQLLAKLAVDEPGENWVDEEYRWSFAQRCEPAHTVYRYRVFLQISSTPLSEESQTQRVHLPQHHSLLPPTPSSRPPLSDT